MTGGSFAIEANVRCRFAPAPSGSLHVGNARSALFSWLFARGRRGTFVLRVEDTDTSRVTEEAFQGVLRDLSWLGMDWDEGPGVGGPHGPYRQSERMGVYADAAERLLQAGHAYRCYCTSQELEARRQAALSRGDPPGYDGLCRTRTPSDVASLEAEGRPSVLRFHMPEHEWTVRDLVKGDVRFPSGQLRDFVIMRSDGSPVFLLAVAVDDMLMEITHVVRGDDLLASAPRNAAVIEALGGVPPAYAHLPQVLGTDGKPLSKRHGSTSVEAFRELGYVPEAMVNYLALLGWSRDDHTTLMTRSELIESFDLERVSSNPAVFDTDKLTWLNNRCIQLTDDDELAARCVPFLTAAGLSIDPAVLRAAMPLVRERMRTLADGVELLRFLFTDDIVPTDKARTLLDKAPEGHLDSAIKELSAVEPWDAAGVGDALDRVAETAGLNRTKGWQPVRAAVTGSHVSPPLPESLELLGRDRTIDRLQRATSRPA